MGLLHIALLTRGSPQAISGGFLYHRRLADRAPAHGAVISFGQESWRWSPRRLDDVVVVDSIAAWRMLPAVVRWRRRVPFVAIVHQRPGGTDGPRLWRLVKGRLDRAVYRRCRATIAASRTLHRCLVDDHGLPPADVVVVEPGCDLPSAPPAGGMRAGRRAAVLSVANWYPNKGIVELLDAVAALPADAATLHLAGRPDVDPAYTTRVRARLTRPDLVGRVVVHGAVDSPTAAGLYAGADVFALASVLEGYATVCAEALASGLPVVGWRRPFLEDFVRDGMEGRLAELGDVPGLTRALADVLDDDRREGFAAAARRRGRTLPTWADTAARFFAVVSGSRADAVEPAHDRPVGVDVDAADAGILHEEPEGQRARDAEGPLDRRLDGADVGDDDDRR
ncbi:MAG TPA: glycosyltransferase family 4 protein [Ilumatobacteraceae bacterium]|nr:glycosyltransferase family 4 protein [Ilumatobacteraceae bacterium]